MRIENTWIFPALEALHLIALALLVGPIALRAFGREASAGTERAGLWILTLTGVVLFASGWERYRENPAFWVKMALLVPALMVKQPRWSLALWTLAILAARAVIDFDA